MTDAALALDLDGLLRRLHLPTVRRLYPELAHRAEGESLAFREFLAVLMAEEVAHRAQTRIQRCVHRGRRTMAIAIAYRAIQNGFDALFTTATALIEDLSAATREDKLRPVLPTYTHPAVLVIDEVRYLGYGPDAANVLF